MRLPGTGRNRTLSRRNRPSGSTHLASTGRPALVRRRAVDPIWPRPGPVPPVAEWVLLPLHIRSLSPHSPFLRCGPGPSSLPSAHGDRNQRNRQILSPRTEQRCQPITCEQLGASANHGTGNRFVFRRLTNEKSGCEQLVTLLSEPARVCSRIMPNATSRGRCGGKKWMRAVKAAALLSFLFFIFY